MKTRRNRPSPYAAACFMICVLLASACSADNTGSAEIKSPAVPVQAAAPAPLSYVMTSVKKIYNNGRNPGDEQSYCKCSFPVFSGGTNTELVNRTVQSYIADSTAISPRDGNGRSGKSIELLADDFLKDYEGFRKEFGRELPYQFELTGSVPLNRQGLLTVEISWEAYTGGAHGMHHIEYLVFDVATGRRLKTADLFIAGFESRLDQFIEARFRQDKGLSKTERLDSEKGTLFENFIRHNDNFALGDKGITFIYNEYEIAAYAFGPTELELSYREIRAILKPAFRNL
ncbi:MAG: DUF3298 and DUF4163 domain-containing protein [Chlorobiaceae bacterium]|nr:DUF3298 and DUF4163 domain-containing protein [Chlorobiaceae bacterium]